ncbi:MAG: LIM domain-containing protein [Ignavibacteriaceae bacterium]|jgi:hypothetical protein
MEKTYCVSCNDVIRDSEIRWAFDDPYCESCFEEGYVYCSRCDGIVGRGDAHTDSNGDYYCSDCWDEQFDDDCPNNPHVSSADRTLIIELSRNWLLGKRTNRSLLKINKNDSMLPKIRDKIGLVEQPIYLFGLKDREEYDLSVSSNLIGSIKEFLLLNGLEWKVTEGVGCNRLGISLSLRQNNFSEVFKLVKYTTQLRIKEIAA